MSFLYKTLLTIFYCSLLFYSIINYFSDSFFVWFTKQTYDSSEAINLIVFLISLLFSIVTILFIIKNEKMTKDVKITWVVISIFFPIALIYFVWKVVPLYK